jgi:hypothetical protein
VVVGLAVGVSVGLTACGAPGEELPSARAVDRVLVVSIDRVGPGELASADTPNLDALMDRGAVGLVASPAVGEALGPDAYATVGAGVVTAVGPAGDLAFGAEETVAGGTAYELWEAVTGREPPEGSVVLPYALGLRAASESKRPRALVGLLGDVLHDAGLRTSVVGNADVLEDEPADRAAVRADVSPEDLPPGVSSEDLLLHRGATLLVADGRGLVDLGEVSPVLLVEDGSVPGGARADPAAVAEATAAALDRAAVVVVDAGDPTRADLVGADDAERREAIERADDLLGAVLGGVDAERTLVVVSGLVPSEAMEDREERLIPIVVAGPAPFRGGLLTSPTSRLDGVVWSTDLAPTVLTALGVPVPDAMLGWPIRVVAAPEGTTDRLAELAEGAEDAAAGSGSDRWSWLILGIAGSLAVLAALTAGGRLGLAVSSLPLWIVLAPGPGPLWTVALPALLAALVWILAGRDRRRWPLLSQVWLAIGAVLLADLAFGAPLQRGSLLGPPLAAAERASWFGDAAVGLVGSAWLAAGWAWLRPRRRAWSRLAFMVATVGLAAWVGLAGQSVAGAVVVTGAGMAAAWLLPDRRVGGLGVLLIGLAALGGGAGVVALDVARPDPGSASDVWRSVQAFGWGEAAGVLASRAADAVRVAATSGWTLVIATTAYAAADAWPRLGRDTQRLLAASGVATGVTLVLTDAGPAAAGWVAVLCCAWIAAGVEAHHRPGAPPTTR